MNREFPELMGMTKAEAERDAAEDRANERRHGVCLCCGEKARLRMMMHVCDRCFDEVEVES